jgi:hypothetical protein
MPIAGVFFWFCRLFMPACGSYHPAKEPGRDGGPSLGNRRCLFVRLPA